MIERPQCKHFLAGRCTRGFNCRYRHVQSIKDPRQLDLGSIASGDAGSKQDSGANIQKKYCTCTQFKFEVWRTFHQLSIHLIKVVAWLLLAIKARCTVETWACWCFWFCAGTKYSYWFRIWFVIVPVTSTNLIAVTLPWIFNFCLVLPYLNDTIIMPFASGSFMQGP